MNLQERFNAPVPLFFRRVQRGGFLLAAGGFLLLLGPLRLPVVAEVAAANLVTAGFVAAALGQLAVGGKRNKSKTNGRFIKRR